MLAINIQEGLTDAWTSIATFVPKLVGFLLILLVGYIVAKVLARIVDGLLERVGFDRWVERGTFGAALRRSSFDASDILAKLVFWAVFLIALQLAFGAFGPNPVSDLLRGLIAYLPRLFVAVVILVIASALAKVVTDLLKATLASVSGGEWIARAAGMAILIFGIFAALNQLQIAPEIVNGLYYAILVAIVGAFIVAVGGGGVRTMQRYWERASSSVESKTDEIKRNADPDAAAMRARQMGGDVTRVPESDPTVTTQTTRTRP
jgi:Conserved TM helix